jgi:hypothetical protein
MASCGSTATPDDRCRASPMSAMHTAPEPTSLAATARHAGSSLLSHSLTSERGGRPLLGQCRASTARVKGAPLRYASATPIPPPLSASLERGDPHRSTLDTARSSTGEKRADGPERRGPEAGRTCGWAWPGAGACGYVVPPRQHAGTAQRLTADGWGRIGISPARRAGSAACGRWVGCALCGGGTSARLGGVRFGGWGAVASRQHAGLACGWWGPGPAVGRAGWVRRWAVRWAGTRWLIRMGREWWLARWWGGASPAAVRGDDWKVWDRGGPGDHVLCVGTVSQTFQSLPGPPRTAPSGAVRHRGGSYRGPGGVPRAQPNYPRTAPRASCCRARRSAARRKAHPPVHGRRQSATQPPGTQARRRYVPPTHRPQPQALPLPAGCARPVGSAPGRVPPRTLLANAVGGVRAGQVLRKA